MAENVVNSAFLGAIQSHMLGNAVASDTDYLNAYNKVCRYFEGKGDKTLKRLPNQQEDNIVLSVADVVERNVASMWGKPVKVDINPADGKTESPWLKKALPTNKLMTILRAIELNASKSGDRWAEIITAGPGFPFPRIIAIDPAIMHAEPDPQDVEVALWFRKRFQMIDHSGKAPRPALFQKEYIPTLVGGGRAKNEMTADYWTLRESTSYDGGSSWVAGETNIWPFAFSPIVHSQCNLRANEYHGESDITFAILALYDAASRIYSTGSRVDRVFSYPWLVRMGVVNSQVVGQGNGLSIGSAIDLPLGADAKLLQSANDRPGSMALLGSIFQRIHDLTSIPILDPEKMRLSGLSGVAMQVMWGPWIDRIEDKRSLAEQWLIELIRRYVIVGGQPEPTDTVVHWFEIIPGDPLTERQVYQADLAMQIVSLRTVSEKLGYDYEEQQKYIDEEKALGRYPGSSVAAPTEGAGVPADCCKDCAECAGGDCCQAGSCCEPGTGCCPLPPVSGGKPGSPNDPNAPKAPGKPGMHHEAVNAVLDKLGVPKHNTKLD